MAWAWVRVSSSGLSGRLVIWFFDLSGSASSSGLACFSISSGSVSFISFIGLLGFLVFIRLMNLIYCQVLRVFYILQSFQGLRADQARQTRVSFLFFLFLFSLFSLFFKCSAGLKMLPLSMPLRGAAFCLLILVSYLIAWDSLVVEVF